MTLREYFIVFVSITYIEIGHMLVNQFLNKLEQKKFRIRRYLLTFAWPILAIIALVVMGVGVLVGLTFGRRNTKRPT